MTLGKLISLTVPLSAQGKQGWLQVGRGTHSFICPKLLLPPPATASETARAGSRPLPPSPLLFTVKQGWGDLVAEWNGHAH